MIVNMDTEHPDQVPVKDAATVMLVRDGSDGLEVFMLQRNLNSDFVGGAYVFPGGAVDHSDGSVDAAHYCRGRSAESASQLLDVTTGGLAFWVAAIRESFEEAGLLFAVDTDGNDLRFDDPALEARFIEHRRRVDSGEISLHQVCDEESLMLRVDEMHYFSRWITPFGAPRRYDTRFFVGAAPAGQTPLHDDHEVIANLWIRPQDALQQHHDGKFQLIFPTVRSLEALTQFDTAQHVIDHAGAIARIDPILPTIVERDGALRIVLPNDEEYDAITSARLR